MRVNKECETAGLKLNIQKTKIMEYNPITVWQIEGEKVKQWQTLFLGSNINVDGDCSHRIRSHLLLERKAMINLNNILKSRDIGS